jgi:hypothetical protein
VECANGPSALGKHGQRGAPSRPSRRRNAHGRYLGNRTGSFSLALGAGALSIATCIRCEDLLPQKGVKTNRQPQRHRRTGTQVRMHLIA